MINDKWLIVEFAKLSKLLLIPCEKFVYLSFYNNKMQYVKAYSLNMKIDTKVQA